MAQMKFARNTATLAVTSGSRVIKSAAWASMVSISRSRTEPTGAAR